MAKLLKLELKIKQKIKIQINENKSLFEILGSTITRY